MGMLLNATIPVRTGNLTWGTKMKSGPPSLSNYVQRQTHQEHSVSVVFPVSGSTFPSPNCSRHFRHLCVTLWEWPMLLTNDIKWKHKNYLRGQNACVELLFLWVLWVPGTSIPCRAQGPAFPQHVKVFLCSWAFLTPSRCSSLGMWPTNANKKQLE